MDIKLTEDDIIRIMAALEAHKQEISAQEYIKDLQKTLYNYADQYHKQILAHTRKLDKIFSKAYYEILDKNKTIHLCSENSNTQSIKNIELEYEEDGIQQFSYEDENGKTHTAHLQLHENADSVTYIDGILIAKWERDEYQAVLFALETFYEELMGDDEE